MRKLSGKITCSSSDVQIPNGASAKIQVIDCGRMDAPSITLGEQIINNPNSFPIHYEVEFDDSFLKAEQFHGRYAVNCSIELGEKLLFVNDTNFNIVGDHEQRELLKTIDFHVIEVKLRRKII